MYREALEIYQTGPKDSAVLANKIGIAYHQMLELDMARRNYERAVKLNPHYAEAINNLGTVYYARKSYRRAMTGVSERCAWSRIRPPFSAILVRRISRARIIRKRRRSISGRCCSIRKSSNGAVRREFCCRTAASKSAPSFISTSPRRTLKQQTDRALLYIRKALEEGFKERDKFQKDPDFAGLQSNPEFKQLMMTEQKIL